MDIIESKHAHGYSLKVTRSLDRTMVSELDKSLKLLWNKHDGAVFVDVSELQSIDSAGLTVFLKWHRKALAEERRFALVQCSGFHLKLLEITRLDEELVVMTEPGGSRVRRVANSA
ncbi:MAG: STAS domain-containing protein [Proteobacteria bacterium]|nr:STAS domain-containing protein [Pseudomonadota bacterium]